VVRASERRFEKNKHTHMLELPVIVCIKKNSGTMLQTKWHSNKGKTATKNQGYPRINTPKNVATHWHLNKMVSNGKPY